MSEQQPLVSVLMTAYNRQQYIAAAIESVLASTYTNFELIIVDDGSTDNTVNIAKKYLQQDSRVKVFVNEKNLGDYPNRNKAASYATGKYIKYFDSDDILYPHCLGVMVSSMEKFPEAGYGLSCIGDEDRPFPVCITPAQAYKEHFSNKYHFNRAPGSSIIKKDAFDKMGGFSGLRQVGDFEFWLKIGCYYPLVKFPVDLYWSRLHHHSEKEMNTEKEKLALKKEVLLKTFSKETVPMNESQKAAALNSMQKDFLSRIKAKALRR